MMQFFFRAAFFTVISFAFFTLIAPDVGAQTCGTSVCTESEFCLDIDGELADFGGIEGCTLYFNAPLFGAAALDNYGGFSVGTRVHVAGCALPYFGFCPNRWSVRDNTIETLQPPGVPALGRSGQVLAVLLVLGIGSFGVWRSRR